MATKTTTKIKWRLSNLPSPEEVIELVTANVLTNDEAREILFSLETEETRNEKSLQDEIKFLRELVAKLSSNPKVIIETIREVEKPWKRYDWYQPYYSYANSGNNQAYLTTTTGTSTNAIMNLSAGTGLSSSTLDGQLQASNLVFTDIKTF
jgi:hypothetical protein